MVVPASALASPSPSKPSLVEVENWLDTTPTDYVARLADVCRKADSLKSRLNAERSLVAGDRMAQLNITLMLLHIADFETTPDGQYCQAAVGFLAGQKR
jgi:hypothetical protein